MAWVRLSDDFYDHPKFDKAGSLGIALFAAGLAWSNRNLTDGFIPRKTALRMLDFEDAVEAVRNADRNGVTNALHNDDLTPAVTRSAVQSLVDAGLWHAEEDGYRIHDYLDYQASKEQIEAGRESNAARQKAWRDRRAAEKQGRKNSESNADRNGVTNGSVTHPPNPNPKEEELLRSSSSTGEVTDLFGNAINNEHPKREPKAKKKTKAEKENDPFFVEFWDAYPKSTHKPTAVNAFANAVDAGADPRQIIAGAHLYAQMWEGATPEERQFITKASNWLNDGCWDGSWHMRDMSQANGGRHLRAVSGDYQPYRNPTDQDAYEGGLL
ncbi:hypothetical protein ABZ234_03915 [Nocardiopsis sp. NPDC006198]|uniref:hypothetical protein n=1 Tax=Nocardiopsis sp. NPDC006198 TaxID=3154472 RepID=UPI0033AACE9D